MWAASYNSGGSILDFLQDDKLCFTTAAPNGTTVAQMGLNNPSIHFVEYVRWKIFLRILNKSKGSISLGLDSIDMLVPVNEPPALKIFKISLVPARRATIFLTILKYIFEEHSRSTFSFNIYYFTVSDT